MKSSIILLGGGGHCKSCIDVLENDEKFKIKGIVEQSGEFIDSILGYL